MPNDAIQTISTRIQYLIQQRLIELHAVEIKYNAAIAELNNILVKLGGTAVNVNLPNVTIGSASPSPAPIMQQARRTKAIPPPEVRRMGVPSVKGGSGSPAKSPPRVATNTEILRKKVSGG